MLTRIRKHQKEIGIPIGNWKVGAMLEMEAFCQSLENRLLSCIQNNNSTHLKFFNILIVCDIPLVPTIKESACGNICNNSVCLNPKKKTTMKKVVLVSLKGNWWVGKLIGLLLRCCITLK